MTLPLVATLLGVLAARLSLTRQTCYWASGEHSSRLAARPCNPAGGGRSHDTPCGAAIESGSRVIKAYSLGRGLRACVTRLVAEAGKGTNVCRLAGCVVGLRLSRHPNQASGGGELTRSGASPGWWGRISPGHSRKVKWKKGESSKSSSGHGSVYPTNRLLQGLP